MLKLLSVLSLMISTLAFAALITSYEVAPDRESMLIRVVVSTEGFPKGATHF